MNFSHVKDVLEHLTHNGIEARIVGGAVRDALLHKQIYDIDIAASADPKCISTILKSICKVIPTGLGHGTVTAVFPHNTFQITSLRHDIKTDGRHAVVSFGTSFEEDAKRRDFTINALYLDKSGKLYDYFNGQDDLEKGIVRFIGDPRTRIFEDYLRILRFFRMQAFYGGAHVHKESLAACTENAEGIRTLSKERIRHEFFKILIAPKALQTIHLMSQSKILDALNHFYDLKSLELYAESETKRHLCVDYFFRFFALFWSSSVKDIAHDFVLSKKERMLFERLSKWIQGSDIRVPELLYHEGMIRARHILCLHEAISGKVLDASFDYLKKLTLQDFPLKAHDLTSLNLKGKQLGEALKAAEKYWLKNDFHPKKEDLIEFLKNSLL